MVFNSFWFYLIHNLQEKMLTIKNCNNLNLTYKFFHIFHLSLNPTHYLCFCLSLFLSLSPLDTHTRWCTHLAIRARKSLFFKTNLLQLGNILRKKKVFGRLYFYFFVIKAIASNATVRSFDSGEEIKNVNFSKKFFFLFQTRDGASLSPESESQLRMLKFN